MVDYHVDDRVDSAYMDVNGGYEATDENCER